MIRDLRYLSASERINYGDLLFPLVFREFFEGSCNFNNYGLVRSDNVNFGALPTKSYRMLLKEVNSQFDILVIGGGEVFFPKWAKLYSFINPIFGSLLKIKFISTIENKIAFASIFLSGKRSYSPYVPYFDIPTVYLSVGGQFPKNIDQSVKDRIVDQLQKSVWLSVRDKRTFRALEKEGLECRLIPDTATLISKVYPLDKVVGLSKIAKETTDKSYIFLQLGINKAPKDIDLFIDQISKLAKRESLQVLCCPIGLAAGHRDDIILKRMVSKSDGWIYIQPNNIFDIINLIAHSKVYIGTSLHGAITAFAYNVPIVPLNKSILKLNSFVDTWAKEFYINSVDFTDVSKAFYRAFEKWDAVKAKNELLRQQKFLIDSFSELKVILTDI